MKLWNQADMELVIPGSAVTLSTDCATGPGIKFLALNQVNMHKKQRKKNILFNCQNKASINK